MTKYKILVNYVFQEYIWACNSLDAEIKRKNWAIRKGIALRFVTVEEA